MGVGNPPPSVRFSYDRLTSGLSALVAVLVIQIQVLLQAGVF